ncbi:hypothetical protein BD310DRAFT_940087 [Dichomitus squalens]|uniref:Uncharacterized protein n=1 Tax=Dichomitus squalens TaxID=114155 RepID=A0A4Q9PHR9_9APHY|nr:hypothetical protein BD310DRAFT_940087 [Dichomitus squalens]
MLIMQRHMIVPHLRPRPSSTKSCIHCLHGCLNGLSMTSRLLYRASVWELHDIRAV